MNITKLKSLIDKHTIISFDIFDTLLKRNVYHPHDVFELVEKEYNLRHKKNLLHKFKENRIEAEKIAREKSNLEDITLDSIYLELPFEPSICNELKQIELYIEYKVSVCNYSIKEVYDYALKQGKKIIAISEMYLPASFIHKLLVNAGYKSINKIYLSSETGKMKKTGSLFQEMLSDYKIKPKHILHIGDAKRSDWIVPKLLGMSSYRIKTHYNNTIYFKLQTNSEFNYCQLYSFINNNLPSDIYQKLGFETFGPLLWGFCSWIHTFAYQKKFKRILFLARDGQIIEKAYKLMYPNDCTEYIYVSRKALSVPLIHFKDKWKDIVALIPRAIHIEMSALFDRLGLNINNYTNLLSELGIDQQEIIEFDKLLSDPRFESLYQKLKNDINKNSIQEYEACANYFYNLNLNNAECIVDLGWKGTIQKSLETLLPLFKIHTQLDGLYLGISMKSSNAHGYIYSYKDMSQITYIRSSLGLIETLFSSNHGTLLKYEFGNPILANFEYDSPQHSSDYQIIKRIQSGALLFIKQFSQNVLSKYIEMDSCLAYTALKELCINPKKRELKTLGNLYFYDTSFIPLAKPSMEDYFSYHKLKFSFSHSYWKIGYLKRLLKIPLPYLYLYSLLREFIKKRT